MLHILSLCNQTLNVVFLQSRELEISVLWKDYRSLCALKFLRLEDFLASQKHGMCLALEPQGTLFAEVSYVTSLHGSLCMRRECMGRLEGQYGIDITLTWQNQKSIYH